MTDPKDRPPDYTDLRRQAEAQLETEAIAPEELSPDQAARLIHELRVHQIELEMQNDELRRSQVELEKSRTKYADIYDFAPVGYLTLDSQGTIVEANLTAATLLGVERSKLLGRLFPHFLVQADRRVLRQLLSNILNQRERRGEVHLKDGDGDIRVMLLDILFLTDAEGRERCRISLADITELKRTQEELRLRTEELIEVNEQLREAKDNLEALFQAAPLAIAAFDAEGKVTRINPAAQRLYGWTLEEVQGRLPLSIPKDSPEEALALLQRLLQGESVTGVEIKQQRQDGSLFDASVSAAPLYDARGRQRGFVGLAEDITARKKLEEDARTQAQVLASMAEGVTVTDDRGQIIYTNPAFDAMFGYEPGELAGRHSNLLNHTPPEENAGWIKDILSSIKTKGIWTGEIRNCRKNGNPFFTLARISTLTVDGKKLYISVQEDITQRKKTQETLQRQAELLDLAYDAILVRDTRGHIMYWNQGAAHHYGWTREEAMGQVSHQLLQTTFPQPLMEIERQVLEQGFWEGELTHTSRQGQKLVMNCRWTAKRNDEGRLVAILEINQDVTVHKQIEQEVQRLASFPLLNPHPVLEVEEEGQILYANPAARHIAEKLGLREGMKAFLPPDLQKLFAAVRQGGPRVYAFDLSLKDRVYAVSLSFPHDLPTARVYALDITERQFAEKALRESEERYRSLVDLSPDGIIVHAKGRYVFANPAGLKLFGAASPENILGQRVLDLVHPDSRETVRLRLKAGERLELREVKILRLDGQAVDVEVAAIPIRYRGQSAVQVVLRDITKRKAAAEALRRSEARERARATELQTVLDAVPTPIFLCHDPDGLSITGNPAAYELLRLPPGSNFSKAAPEEERPDYQVFKDGRELAIPELPVQRARTGQTVRDFEYDLVLADGTVRHVLANATPLLDEAGQPRGAVAAFLDITERQRAEAALRESEERYRSLFENSHAVMLLLDPETGAIVDANPAAAAYYGYSREELLARRITDINTLNPEQVKEEMQRAREEARKHFEFKHRLATGEVRDVEVFSGPILVKGRELLYSIVHDITARKEAEDALRESEARFRSLFDHMAEGVALHEVIYDEKGTARDYRILATNPAFSVHTGLTAEQVQGRLASEAYGVAEAPYLETFARVAHIGQPETFETFFPPLQRHYRLSATSPSPGQFVTVFEDITDRKRMEEALRESEERFRTLANAIPQLAWIADSDGYIFWYNQRWYDYTGTTPEDMKGWGWQSVHDPKVLPEVLEQWRISLTTAKPFDMVFPLRGSDGQFRQFLTRVLPVKDASGQVVKWFGTNTDVTEGQQMEEALRRARDELEVRVEERTAALRQANEQLLLEIEERQTVEDRLRDSEARFTAFMEYLPGLAVMRDVEGRYLYANLAWEETMGMEQGAWQGQTLAELWPPEQAAALQKSDFQIISSGEPTEEVEVQVLADGPHHFLTKRFPIRDAGGLPYMVGAIAIDVTDRQRAEQQVAETGRLYRVLSQVNEAIMRGREQEALFEQVCRIAVEEGLFPMAWVGLTDPVSQTIRVAAKYGLDEGYLDNLSIPVRDGAESQGPTGTAVREDRYDISNDVSQDPRLAPWREEALARGYRASGAFPLRIGAQVVGAITLYAQRPEFFTHKEITLLTSLADNLSFALESLDREAKRRQAEEALATERQRLFDLLENLPAFIYLQAPDYSLRFANREFRQRFGEPHGGACYTLIWGRDEPCPDCPTFSVFHTGQPKEWEWNAPDGRIYQVYDYPFADVDGSPLVLEMGIDITQRKRTEEALAEQAMLVQDLYNNAPCGYHSLDSEGYYVQINDTELAWLGYTREDVVGRLKYTDLLTAESLKTFQETFPQFKDRGWVKDLEYDMIRKDGTVFPVLLSASAITDEAGNFLMGRSTVYDITDRKRAEQALARSEAMLRLVLDTLPVGVWVTDRVGRIIEGNPAARRIWGGARYVSVEEYGEYQGWWADSGKKIEADEWALARAVQKGETSLGEVINIQCFDGSRKTIINSGVPLFGENREILGAIVVNQDITEMIRAEEVIREQGRQLEAFFAHSITPLVFLDRDFNFLRVNEAYARACQRNAQEFIGRNHFEFYPHAENQAIFAEVVHSKTSYQVQAKPFEFLDHPEWGVTYWDWSLTPILDQAGEVDFLVFSLRDVTRRVKSEQARNRLIEILEATPDFVGIADFYGQLQYLNRAGRAMVGVGEHEDITGLRVLDLHPKEIGQLILEKGSPTAIKEGAWQAELALLHRDGREIPVSQVILAHKDPNGRVQFFSTVARDISDIKEARESILRQTAILDGINRIFRETLSCETAADLAQTCLAIAEVLTDSGCGFITEIDQDNRLSALALTEPDWQSSGLRPARDLSQIKKFELAGLLVRPLKEGKAVIANDPAAFPEDTGTAEGYPPLTAYLGMPLVYGGTTLGLLGLGNKEGGYTLADKETVESLAPAIVEALMHYRAEEALKGSERKLRYLADQLLTAQENERKRLAAELHDELGHALLALKLHLSSIEKKLPPEQENIKEEIRSQLDYIHEVIQDVRRLYHDLSPGDVEDLGLTKALGTLINDFAGHFPQINWQVELTDLQGLFSLPVQTTIYRIVQEALTNIGKHANPTAVTIACKGTNDWVQFVIQDNGAGFDAAQAFGSRGSGRGVGLVAMEERLNMVGGSFEIQSRVQEGTRLSFTIPVIPEGERP